MTAFLLVGAAGLLVVLAGVFLEELLDGAVDAVLPFDLGPGVTAALGSAVAAFGFGGALALRSSGLSVGAACALGTAGALVVGAAAFCASRALIGGHAPPARASELYGVFGTVITPIPRTGMGEIALVHRGMRVKLAARAEQALSVRTPVYVLEVLSDTAVVVAPATPILPNLVEESS